MLEYLPRTDVLVLRIMLEFAKERYMHVPEFLALLQGEWNGTCRLVRPWLEGEEREVHDTSTAVVSFAARHTVVTISYQWILDDELQGGMLIFGVNNDQDSVQSVWVDSWHQNEQFMLCQGTSIDQGAITLHGTYAGPSGPAWGWRTEIIPNGADEWRIEMYNLPPESAAELAFELQYSR